MPMTRSVGRKVRVVPNALPITLRVYRRLSAALTPLAPVLIKQRLKQNKEDPARLDERRGISQIERPAGPLVWIHGASVGEVLAAAALIERLRALGMRILLTSGTVTSAEIIAKRFPTDIIHQYIPYDSPRYRGALPRSLEADAWRCSSRADLWPNLIISAAKRRLPMVLINARMSQRSFPRWQKMFGDHRRLARPFRDLPGAVETDAERFSALGGRATSS